MDCIGRAAELAGLRGLTVWKQRVEAGRGSDRTDSGHEVADSSGQVGRGFADSPAGFCSVVRQSFTGDLVVRGLTQVWLVCVRLWLCEAGWI